MCTVRGIVDAAMPWLEKSSHASILDYRERLGRAAKSISAAGPYGAFKAAIVALHQCLAHRSRPSSPRDSVSPCNTYSRAACGQQSSRQRPQLPAIPKALHRALLR